MTNEFKNRLDMIEQAKDRVRGIELGAPVTNVCAGDMGRHGHFVEFKAKSYKNSYGITHNTYDARCKMCGKIGNYGIEVIYPGHLDADECKEIFSPIHKILFPSSYREKG